MKKKKACRTYAVVHDKVLETGGGGYFLVKGYWGCAAGWGRIFTTGLPDYNGVGVLRGQRHIPSRNWPKPYPPGLGNLHKQVLSLERKLERGQKVLLYEMELWKNQFVQCVDKHAPLKTKRVGAKRSPWINNELVSLMRKRDYLKKKATKDKSSEAWDQFKQARNQTNNAIREAKR